MRFIGTVKLTSGALSRDNVPHLNEHHCEIPHRFAPHKDRIILPMSESGLLVDVLVGDIYSACDAHVSVNDKYLSVVTVVLHRRYHRAERVENQRFYALFSHFLLVSERQGELAAHAVIDESDLYALRDLFEKYLDDLLPHLAVVNDEILHKDELFRLAKLFKHDGELCLAEREIDRIGVPVCGVAAVMVDISHHFLKIPVLRLDSVHQCPVGLEIFLGLLALFGVLCFEPSGGILVVEYEVQNRGEHGNSNKRHDPCKLIRRVLVGVDDDEAEEHRKHRKNDADI